VSGGRIRWLRLSGLGCFWLKTRRRKTSRKRAVLVRESIVYPMHFVTLDPLISIFFLVWSQHNESTTPAGEQDQDFYIRHPEPYAHYKNNCGRSERLKEVWGEEVYDCYHDETHSCFVPGEMIAAVITDGMIVTAITDGSNVTDDLLLVGKILNSYGDVVVAESNTKSAPEGEKPLDVVGIILISLAVLAVLVCVVKANLP